NARSFRRARPNPPDARVRTETLRAGPVTAAKPLVVTLGRDDALAALDEQGLAPRPAAHPAQALAALHEARARALLVHAERARVPALVADSRQHAPFTEVFVWAPGGASPRLVRDALRSGAEDVVLDPDPAVLASSVA